MTRRSRITIHEAALLATTSFALLFHTDITVVHGKNVVQRQLLPWWHPSIQTIADELMAAPPGHPPLDTGSFQDFVEANTNKNHKFFDGPDGYILSPWDIGNHPALDPFFIHEDEPDYEEVFPSVYFDHPDIELALKEGKVLPNLHPSVMDMFNELLPSNHPDIDDLFTTGVPHELPEWHPDISLMINIKELPMGGQEPALPVYAINHPNISKSYEEGRPMPPGHISITDKLKEYLPPGHPIDLDEMMGNPLKYPLPFGHPKLEHFITMEEEYPNGLPEVPVYFEHPDITKAYDAGRGLPAGHVSVEERLLDYLPPGHPTNIDDMLSNPKQYPLPLGHPGLSTFVEMSEYPNGLPSVPVYFEHPDISTAFDTGRVLPKVHPSVTEMFLEFLPPGHPTNIDDMLTNPNDYRLPLGHPNLSSFVKISALPQGSPSVPVYFAHPNITKAYEAGRPMPPGHVSVADKLTEYLPPNHPGNLDEMLQNPNQYPLPFGHPSLEQFISVETYPNGLPELQVYFQHPNITKSYDAGRGLPAGHVSVEDKLIDFCPPGHPTNIDEMLSNPKEYPLPLGHPSLEQFVSINDYPNGLPSIPVYFEHPSISAAFEAGRPIPDGHPSVTEMLSDFIPEGHPTNLDQMIKDPLKYPLPLGHPSLEQFISIEELPNGLPSIPAFSAHPDIDKSLSRRDAMPKSHPSVTALLIEHLPPHHPLDLDEMLRDPQLELPLGHPSLSLMLVQEVTESEISRSFRKASEIKLSVFSDHPDLAIHKTQKSIKHHPTIDHLFADVLPSFHPNLDELMEEGFTLPSWHPDIAPMVEPRDQILSPGALLCYAFSVLFLIAVLVRNTKSWINSMSTKETLAGKQTNEQSKHPDLHSTSSNECTIDSTFKSASNHTYTFDDCTLDKSSGGSPSDNDAVPLPQLDYRNTKAMELNKLHHDENLTSEMEPTRASIISYQEKKNTKLRSTWHSALGRRICGTHLSNGGAIFRLFYVGVNLAALFLSPYDINVGLGSLATGNIVFLVTSATKNSAYTWLLGIAFDQTVAYHRFIGYITVGIALVHACFYFDRLMDLMSDRVYKTGFIALMFGISLVISSLNWIRRRYFNVFYYSHAAFIGFIVCVYMHAAGARPFILASIGFYALDKMLHLLWTQLPRKTLLIEKVGGRDTAFVRVGKTPLNRILGRYKVGQYVFVNFPELSLTEWHPYSVASSPSQEYIDLYIRALGNHTKKIVDYADICALENKQAAIRVDGPYGNLSFNYRRYGSLVMTAGGIGITPIMSLVEDIYEGENAHKIAHCLRSIRVVWVMPFASEAVLFLDKLLAYRQKGEIDPSLPALDFSLHITREVVPPFATVPTFLSRPDFSSVVDSCIEKSSEQDRTSMLVFACGPGSMVNQMWDASVKGESKGLRIDFHHETFDF